MFDQIDVYTLLGIAGCLLLVLMIVLFFKEICREHDKHQEAVKEMERLEEGEEDLPELILRNARVLDKRFKSDVIGTKNVRQVSSYFVTFFTEEGETVEYAVPEEVFLRIEKGQESTLVTSGGEFFDFGDGEPIRQEE